MLVGLAVHTTGVNWDAVLANMASVTVILGAFGALVVRTLRRSIKDEIQTVISKEVAPTLIRINDRLDEHDTRIARLEGVEEGRRQTIAQTALAKP